MKPIYIIFSVALILIFLLYKEIRRPDKAFLLGRLFATIIVAVSMVGFIVPFTFHQKISQSKNGIILLTAGTNRAALKTLTGKKYSVDLLLRDSSTKVISDLSYFLTANPWVREIDLYGYGLPPSSLKKLSNYKLNFHPPKGPTGIINIGWQPKIKTGRPLIIQGRYQNNSEKPVKLILRGLGRQIDSLAIPASTVKSFSFQSYPKQLGKSLYQLISVQQGDTLAQEPLPLITERQDEMRILVLASSPDFENKFLKRWLFESQYQLAFRTQISKQKYTFDFLNIDSVNLANLNASTLKKFDVLLIDEEELATINQSEKLAISGAVNSGMGLLVRISGNKALATTINSFQRYEAAAPPNKKSLINISETDFKFHALPLEQTLYLTPKQSHQPLVKDQNSRILVSSSINGLGIIAVTSLSSTYNWVLSGKQQDYATYWAHLLSKIARKKMDETTVQLVPKLPIINEKLRIIADMRDSNMPPEMMFKDKSLAPRQNMELPFRWDASFWPKTTGWNSIEINKQIHDFYVFKNTDWQALRSQELIDINQQTPSTIQKAGSPIKESSIITKTVSKWWFFIGILVGMGFLWLESRRLNAK